MCSARPICSSSGQETEGSAIREGKYFLDGLRLVCAGPLEPFGYLLSYTVVPYVSKIVRLSSPSYPLFAKLDPRLLSSLSCPYVPQAVSVFRQYPQLLADERTVALCPASGQPRPDEDSRIEIIADTRVPNYIAARKFVSSRCEINYEIGRWGPLYSEAKFDFSRPF